MFFNLHSICFEVKYFQMQNIIPIKYYCVFGLTCQNFQARTTKIGGLANGAISAEGPVLDLHSHC